MFRRCFVILCLSLFSTLSSAHAPKPGGAAPPADWREAMTRFAREVAARHGWDEKALLKTLSTARYRQSIIDAMNRPAEAMPWHRYRKIFMQPRRIAEGARFWRENRELLERAEQRWGVPPQLITAIIGVETYYGQRAGTYPVLDALATLAFAYPKRSRFFARELEEFLRLGHDEGIDPTRALGSYAGAIGMPQFIPSSYRAYAVDFDGDGRRDLLGSTADVVGSVANYFARHGWKPGGPVALKLKASQVPPGVSEDMKPSIPLSRFVDLGVQLPKGARPSDRGALIALQQEDGTDHWLGFDNFYVITRYNHSNLYAMAVHQLSQAIRERIDEERERRKR